MTPPKSTAAPELEGQVSIDEYLSHDFDTLMEGEEEVHLGGDQDATWALRKLATLRKQVAANNAIAEAEANRIAAWLAAVNEPLRKQVQFVEGILNGYAIHERGKDRKTIVLPYGKLATRPVADKWEVVDADAFVAWAQENKHPELVKTTVKPEALTVIKTALNLTEDGTVLSPEGEPVPGVTFTHTDDVTVTITTL